MAKIKLLICYHKKAPLLKDDILTPIHVGRANAKKSMDHDSAGYQWLMDNLIGDDTGDNISDRNGCYNEMTAIYWAWKNYAVLGDPDYIGLMHYRRHFVLNPDSLDVLNIRNFDPDTYLDEINYSEERIQELVKGCDFLPHIGKVINVYRHYTENQRKEDIDLANTIILEKYPEYRETMKRYYAGDYSNFCNMCIFSRELFFQYCEWIFSILEEFEKRVDMSEKRFFISERLTGIFVAKLMENPNLKYKALPIAFIDERTDIPVAINVSSFSVQEAAISIQSIINTSDGYNSYHFYLMCDESVAPDEQRCLANMASEVEYCKIETISHSYRTEVLPIYLPELLPKVNKCIYIAGKVISLKDIGEFYRICSVDDYFLVGIPETKYDPAEKKKQIQDTLMVLNCRRMRGHHLSEQIQDDCDLDSVNRICAGEIGYIPWYLFTSERLALGSSRVLPPGKRRSDVQSEALWRPFLVYDYLDPAENNQGVYSVFWWNVFRTIPLYFQCMTISLNILERLYTEQQKEVNAANEYPSEPQPVQEPQPSEYVEEPGVPEEKAEYVEEPQSSEEQSQSAETPLEEWRTFGFWGKFKFYYVHNGFKQTIKYAFKKLLGGV